MTTSPAGMTEDYYALLGVDRDASEDAILQAYREKAAEFHPDVCDSPDAESDFQALNRAKSVLTDPDERRAYDRLGHDQYVRGAASAADADRSGSDLQDSPTGRPFHRRREEPLGPSLELGRLLNSMFGSLGGQAVGRGRSEPAGVHPFDVDLESAFREAMVQGTDSMTARQADPDERDGDSGVNCPKCRGRGSFIHDIDTGRGYRRRLEACERCGGSGTVSR